MLIKYANERVPFHDYFCKYEELNNFRFNYYISFTEYFVNIKSIAYTSLLTFPFF